ncbi:MAG: PilZ domain-containing protein, partial [Candidatus Omnitrophica bacterium]|nr:PilZ domain-containing protein [Candidatus Omnitrophota bacterium]
MNQQPQGQERRKYIRLNSVFPVSFRLTTLDGQEYISDWLQGFTNNISSGGIRLSANDLKEEFVDLIKKGEASFILKIQIPLSAKPVLCRAKAAWVESEAAEPPAYSIGLAYEEILPEQSKRML